MLTGFYFRKKGELLTALIIIYIHCYDEGEDYPIFIIK